MPEKHRMLYLKFITSLDRKTCVLPTADRNRMSEGAKCLPTSSWQVIDWLKNSERRKSILPF